MKPLVLEEVMESELEHRVGGSRLFFPSSVTLIVPSIFGTTLGHTTQPRASYPAVMEDALTFWLDSGLSSFSVPDLEREHFVLLWLIYSFICVCKETTSRHLE